MAKSSTATEELAVRTRLIVVLTAAALVGEHLVVFTFGAGSATERPDPTLEHVVRHHAGEFESGRG